MLTDLHCHGGGGHYFGDSVESSLAAAAAHREAGTAAMVGSLVTQPFDRTADALAIMREAMSEDPSILGVHLEGPFLAPARKGAHDGALLRDPSADAIDALLRAGEGVLRQITIAPELPGALDAIERLTDAGVVVAVGHTEADADTARQAFDRGATLVTHAFNAMRGITGREVGPAGAALADERVHLELIADGMHLDPSLIRTVFAAAPGRVVLVTDAMSAAAAPDGDYRIGQLDVTVTAGKAVLSGTDTLAGSTLTLARAVEVATQAGVEPEAALAAASATPRRVLGLD